MPITPIYLLIFFIIKIIRKPKKMEVPVICVGNITTGGTGKTPAVIHIARLLKDEGLYPGIVSRGYKGSMSKAGGIVSDGEKIFMSPEEAGDEPYLMAMTLKDIPVAIGSNRVEAIHRLMDGANVNIIIMDDGFQNFSVIKDISIIIIDALKPFGNGLVIPAGDLREPGSGIRRADLILMNKSDLVDKERLLQLRERIKNIAPEPLIFNSIYLADYLYQVDDENQVEPVSVIKGKKILLITAIGNPHAFQQIIERFEPEAVELLFYPDHNWFNFEDIQGFIRESESYDYVIVTEKDYVRLRGFNLNSKFYFLRINLDIDDKSSFKRHLLDFIE